MDVDDYLPEEEQPPRITFERRLSAGGRTYEFTAFRTGEGPITLRLAGGEPGSEIVAEVSGVIPPDDLPAVTDFLTSSLAGMVATVHRPAARRTSSLASKRQTHPNLGARWTRDEERRLVARHREGATVDDLMAEHGRNRGGIVRRLERLGALPADQWRSTSDDAARNAA